MENGKLRASEAATAKQIKILKLGHKMIERKCNRQKHAIDVSIGSPTRLPPLLTTTLAPTPTRPLQFPSLLTTLRLSDQLPPSVCP